MNKQTKLDIGIVALFILGAFLVISSLFMPPLGVISASVISVFGIIAVLISIVLAIQTHYTIELHFGENKKFIWKPEREIEK